MDDAMHTPRIDVSGAPLVTADPTLSAGVIDALTERHEVQVAQGLPGVLCQPEPGRPRGRRDDSGSGLRHLALGPGGRCTLIAFTNSST